jgi:hypothetical protein
VCYQSQLIIMLCFTKGTSLRKHATNSSSPGLEARPPCYQSQLIIMLCFHEGHVPPCYQSQLIITFVFSRARPSVYHHNSSSCCVFTKGTSSVLSITTHHHCVFTKGIPPCYQSQLIISCFTRKGHVLRAINHNSSSCCVFNKRHVLQHQSQLITLCFHERARPCVSITTHHHCSRKGVPPCYQSQLIIMLCHECPPCYQSQLIITLCFSRKARPSVLSITTHHQVGFQKARPSVLSITTHHHVVFSRHVLPPCINHNSSSC